jgi:hypothetical protein
MADQGPWPKPAPSPPAWTLTPDGFLRSDRELCGPLRLGTSLGVGPRGSVRAGFGTDYGVDRVSPRSFDPMGTSDQRAPRFPTSERVSTEIRQEQRRRR